MTGPVTDLDDRPSDDDVGRTETDGVLGDATAPTSERVALWVFVAYLVVAVPVLVKFGSDRWFLGDEWSFLTTRSVGNFNDLMRPHNQHWSTIPVLVNQALYAVFGLRSYLPYQLPVIFLHLTIAALIRVVMRRSGVRPWLATAAAGTFVLFGPGSDNILWAFQVGFTATIVFGLTQMLLSDHGGPIDRRDWLGLGAGFLSLLCTGLAPSIIIATGIAVLLKRGWRQAAFHTVPLGIIYAVWYVAAGASLGAAADQTGGTPPPFTAGAYVTWMKAAAVGLFEGLGHFAVLGVVLAALLVVGWVVAWRTLDRATFRREGAMPGALLVGAVIAMTATAPQRFFLGEQASQASRYVGLMAALALPALAFAANAVARTWKPLTPVVLVLLLLPIPWNIWVFTQDDPLFGPDYFSRVKTLVTTLPVTPGIEDVPRWVTPDPSFLGQPGLTVGWLLDAERDGKLPPPGTFDAVAATQVAVRIHVALKEGTPDRPTTCQVRTAGVAVTPKRGDQWLMKSPLRVSVARNGQRAGFPVPFEPNRLQSTLEIESDGASYWLEPAAGAPSFELCTPAP